MRSKSIYLTILFCSLTIFSWLILTEAHPVDDDIETSLGFTSNEVTKDDGSIGKSQAQAQTTTRPKRTIGFLRQLFPGISQIIDRKIQSITRVLFRVVGRLILRGGNRSGANSGGDSSDGSGGRRISITLPTYPPIEDEDETEASNTDKPDSNSLPDIRFGGSNSSANNNSSSKTNSSSDAPASTDTPESNTIVRKVRDVGDPSETTVSFDDELISSETSTKRQGLFQRLGNEMRKKRGSLGSGGGSGNFLFDLIRLVAGSGVSPEKDEELNAPRDERDESIVDGTDTTAPSDNSEDNYTSGIPGPLTRLFVLANRGLSNLIQDLILRLAQTSERIVNFKARLITAII